MGTQVSQDKIILCRIIDKKEANCMNDAESKEYIRAYEKWESEQFADTE